MNALHAIRGMSSTIGSRVDDLRYHRCLNRQAGHLLRTLGATLDPAIERRCVEYAEEFFGSRRFAPWLRVYATIAGEFRDGWIPDNYYGRVVVPSFTGAYGRVAALKSLSPRLFASDRFPQIGAFVNGLWILEDDGAVDESAFVARLFRNTDRVVFKLDTSVQGRGVMVFDRDSFAADTVRSLGNGVFQRYIEQHPDLDALMPGSVATIRLTTVFQDDGIASVRGAYLRLGRSADTHVRSKSHIRVAADRATGALDSEGFLPDWRRIDRHPDTGAIFSGRSIPSFAKCAETATTLHRRLPHARCIGWDLTVDADDEVCIMEWNGGHNDIKFSEATQGPCFADLGWEGLWRGRR